MDWKQLRLDLVRKLVLKSELPLNACIAIAVQLGPEGSTRRWFFRPKWVSVLWSGPIVARWQINHTSLAMTMKGDNLWFANGLGVMRNTL